MRDLKSTPWARGATLAAVLSSLSAGAAESLSRGDEILLRAVDLEHAERVATAIGATIERVSPYTDAVVLRVPEGSAEWLAKAAAELPGVRAAYVHPEVRATASGTSKSGSSRTLQVSATTPTTTAPPPISSFQYQQKWEATPGAWAAAPRLGAGVVIAVLDTGVSPSTSLPASAILPGANFLEPGATAADDNGHGTHMATIAAARGSLYGVAPAATVLPVKVLDAERCGTELALVDGIHFAASVPGVKVINLSLAFPIGYAPSALLAEAVTAAQARGVVVVGASGNDGAPAVAYPAALPGVIAVGAGELTTRGTGSLGVAAADYANKSARLDVIAIGGRLDADADGNGVPDGILGDEVFNGVSSPHLTAGTSPAAASVSGLVALMAGAGIPSSEIGERLRQTATDVEISGVGFDAATGAGLVNGARALTAPVVTPAALDVALAPRFVNTLSGAGGALNLVPETDVELRTAAGAPVPNAAVFVHFGGALEETVRVVTDEQGFARARPRPTLAPRDAFVSVVAEAAIDPATGRTVRPSLVATFDVLSYQLLSGLTGGLDATLVAFDTIQDDTTTADELTNGLVVRPLGTGLTTSGFVYLLSPYCFLDSGFASSSLILASRGTGLTTSAIVLDTSYVTSSYLYLLGSSSLLLRSGTYGTGLTTSAIIWNGYFYSPLQFQLSGTLSVLKTTTATGLTTSGYVYTSPYLSTSLYSTRLYTSTLTLYATSLEAVTEDSLEEYGLDVEGVGSVPGEASLARSYSELSVFDGTPGETRAAEKRAFGAAGKAKFAPAAK